MIIFYFLGFLFNCPPGIQEPRCSLTPPMILCQAQLTHQLLGLNPNPSMRTSGLHLDFFPEPFPRAIPDQDLSSRSTDDLGALWDRECRSKVPWLHSKNLIPNMPLCLPKIQLLKAILCQDHLAEVISEMIQIPLSPQQVPSPLLTDRLAHGHRVISPKQTTHLSQTIHLSKVITHWSSTSKTKEISQASLKPWVCSIKFKACSYFFGRRKESNCILLCTLVLRERQKSHHTTLINKDWVPRVCG